MDESGSARRRRRRRRGGEAEVPAERPAPVAEQQPAAPPPPAARGDRPRRGRRDAGERGLADLVGAGHSQLDPVRAMRARELNRPTDDDLAAAEAELVIVRRNWVPPESRG